ncbi:hypothetical protein TWF696_003751 [Orbilia brochopaga]|uniref:Oxidoreductase AflY n=1 Tax=Orbilia brochopaga TaxID=3140254 RepID=A0AAV9V738_9PEZI
MNTSGSIAEGVNLTASKIYLQSPPASGAALPKATPESSAKASALLQQNHDNLHTFFDFEDRLHNHIAHHLLAIYALGADPANLQFAFDTNIKMQKPIGDEKPPALQTISQSTSWEDYLGKTELYHTFLEFFQNAINEVGWEKTIAQYLFSEQAVKDGMPERLVAGFLHPWIHLGYGIEFEQPAIVAEALAQTAVHDAWPSRYLKACAAAAAEAPKSDRPTMLSLAQEAHGSAKLRGSVKWSDPQKNKAVYANAFDEMVALAAKWHIAADADDATIRQAAAELASAAAYICAATPRTDKKVKFDFFLMHTVNSSVFLDVWVRQPWVTNAQKALLINYFGWMVINMYVSRGCADLNIEQVDTYKPKGGEAACENWEVIAARVVGLKDDGHVPKMVRALMNAAEVTEAYETLPGFGVGRERFLKIAAMAVDAAEDCAEGEPLWVRSVGHEEAWEKVPARL